MRAGICLLVTMLGSAGALAGEPKSVVRQKMADRRLNSLRMLLHDNVNLGAHPTPRDLRLVGEVLLTHPKRVAASLEPNADVLRLLQEYAFGNLEWHLDTALRQNPILHGVADGFRFALDGWRVAVKKTRAERGWRRWLTPAFTVDEDGHAVHQPTWILGGGRYFREDGAELLRWSPADEGLDDD